MKHEWSKNPVDCPACQEVFEVEGTYPAYDHYKSGQLQLELKYRSDGGQDD